MLGQAKENTRPATAAVSSKPVSRTTADFLGGAQPSATSAAAPYVRDARGVTRAERPTHTPQRNERNAEARTRRFRAARGGIRTYGNASSIAIGVSRVPVTMRAAPIAAPVAPATPVPAATTAPVTAAPAEATATTSTATSTAAPKAEASALARLNVHLAELKEESARQRTALERGMHAHGGALLYTFAQYLTGTVPLLARHPPSRTV